MGLTNITPPPGPPPEKNMAPMYDKGSLFYSNCGHVGSTLKLAPVAALFLSNLAGPPSPRVVRRSAALPRTFLLSRIWQRAFCAPKPSAV
jgi:hypothetical protein